MTGVLVATASAAKCGNVINAFIAKILEILFPLKARPALDSARPHCQWALPQIDGDRARLGIELQDGSQIDYELEVSFIQRRDRRRCRLLWPAAGVASCLF